MRVVLAIVLCLLAGMVNAAPVGIGNFGIEQEHPLQSTWPQLPVGGYRIWSSQCQPLSSAKANWSGIETARGVYDWTCLDAMVAVAQAKGLPIIYTFGKVPGWANGNAGTAVPPTDFQDFYDFVTAITARYGTRIQYYEVWNEYGSTVFWTGTVAQIYTLAQNIYPIIHAVGAQVLCPSIGAYPVTKDDQLYALGVGSYCDVMNTHSYYYGLTTDANYFAPENIFEQMYQYQQLFARYSLSSKPWYADEGAILRSDVTTPTQNQLAFIGVWHLAFACSGLARWSWFEPDNDDGTVFVPPLQDATYPIGLNPRGIALRTMNSWLIGKTVASCARTVGTNQVRNPTATGFVAGTLNGASPTGSMPTNWSSNPPDAANGITVSITGSCSEDGHTGAVFRAQGTWNGVGTSNWAINFDGARPTAAQNQTWSIQAYVKIVGGSLAGTAPRIRLSAYDGSSVNLGFIGVNRAILTTASLGNDLMWAFGPTTDASTASVSGQFSQTFTPGVAVDLSVCIADAREDSGSVWTGLLTGSGGYQAEFAWDMNGYYAPATFAVPNTYSYLRDLYGQSGTVAASGNYTLSNVPVLFENQQFKGWLQ